MQELRLFQETVWDYYHTSGRQLPWRQLPIDPYHVLVSEMMLQQTQVTRVIPKYNDFLRRFPTVQQLARASLADVLVAWSGLGYNRRAKFLWLAAQQIGTTFPKTINELVQLPGVGINTAGAIVAYAYNQPVVFVETNIRTVFIHHFFADRSDVTDTEIRQLVEQTLPASGETRDWYWALMDYGTHLKASIGNLSRNSKHYGKQSTFAGSRRQLRGQLIRLLTERAYTTTELVKLLPDARLEEVIGELQKESIIRQSGQQVHL